jgi:hypothetical protein
MSNQFKEILKGLLEEKMLIVKQSMLSGFIKLTDRI